MVTNQQLHERILYPVVRVRSGNVGGSGVIIYSQPDSKNKGKYLNFALTCQHVVANSIKMRDEWNSVVKRNKKTDYFEEVLIDVFDYDGSKVVSSNATPADIIAYNEYHDIAVVKLQNPRKMEFVASLYPRDKIPDLERFDKVWTSGCSLLHDPFASSGELTYLREIIEQKSYIMANAPSIFGNSGGGLFHEGTMSLLGLTSRVTTIQLGFGMDVMPWMQFSTHPERLYEFFDEDELQFLYDDKDDYYSGMARRERRTKDALRDLLVSEPDKKSGDVDPMQYGAHHGYT